MSEGLTCRTGDRTRTFAKAELEDWVGQRAQAGRLPPNGFPRARKFD
jgi:topoisomerase-4 subunit A